MYHTLTTFTTPVDQVYEEAKDFWHRLCEIFPPKQKRGPPRILLFDSRKLRSGDKGAVMQRIAQGRAGEHLADLLQFTLPEVEQWMRDKKDLEAEVLKYVEVLPEDFSADDVISHLLQISQLDSGAAYNPQTNTIVMDGHIDRDDYLMALAHEVTHAVTAVHDAEMTVSTGDLHTFQTEFYGSNRRLLRVFEAFGEGKFLVNINEFFPPIGQSYLLRSQLPSEATLKAWEWKLGELNPFIYGSPPAWALRDRSFWTRAQDLAKYLPLIAGIRVVELYNGDVRAFVREHKDIATAPPVRIWVKYCKPLLQKGRVEPRNRVVTKIAEWRQLLQNLVD